MACWSGEPGLSQGSCGHGVGESLFVRGELAALTNKCIPGFIAGTGIVHHARVVVQSLRLLLSCDSAIFQGFVFCLWPMERNRKPKKRHIWGNDMAIFTKHFRH